MAAVTLGALAAMVLGIWLAYSSWQHRQPIAWTRQLTVTQLRPGDCLSGSNLGLGTGSATGLRPVFSAWPHTMTAVPCTQWHLAEVIFAGNLWPASLAAYPGEFPISDAVDERCQAVLWAYAGRTNPSLTYATIAPSGSDWDSGDRLGVCIAWEPGVALLNSVKAPHR